MIKKIINNLLNFVLDILNIDIKNKQSNSSYYNYDYDDSTPNLYHNRINHNNLVANNNHSDSTNYYISANISNNYVPKSLMTNSEKKFYFKIKELESNYKIIPQINLAAVIQKNDNSPFHNELFRNIDFAIFSNDYSKLLLLIELNDASHNKKQRIKRDKKVNTICYHAGIRLITFYTKYANTKEYVIKRILEEIKKTI